MFLNFCGNPESYIMSLSARGLDIPSIKTVVNYDVARDIDTHTHRVGRTGRAGNSWIKVFRIIPDFRILRLTFHRKSASKC